MTFNIIVIQTCSYDVRLFRAKFGSLTSECWFCELHPWTSTRMYCFPHRQKRIELLNLPPNQPNIEEILQQQHRLEKMVTISARVQMGCSDRFTTLTCGVDSRPLTIRRAHSDTASQEFVACVTSNTTCRIKYRVTPATHYQSILRRGQHWASHLKQTIFSLVMKNQIRILPGSYGKRIERAQGILQECLCIVNHENDLLTGHTNIII